jgi:hypothetical protein
MTAADLRHLLNRICLTLCISRKEVYMSIAFKLADGQELDAHLSLLLQGEEIRIGKYDMSLEEFTGMVTHLLLGGLFGWNGQITPEPVNKTLSQLFEMYEKGADGRWVRKVKYQPPAFSTTVQPTTFKELVKSTGPTGWRAILRLLKKKGKRIMVAESPICMGRYSAVILTGEGFQLESGKAGMAAAFTGGSDPICIPIEKTASVLERAIAFSGPLEDDPPDTPTPSEGEIVAKLLREIEEFRNLK